jgi:4a-hydroxytetrahydrobiopterin dehydratase
MARPKISAFSEPEIRARLSAELPHWRYEDGAIRRVFKTYGWKSTVMAFNAVAHLAEAAWHHPDVKVSYASLEVALSTHEAKGISERDLALARKIEEVVAWRPGEEGGPLEGAPDDERDGYIKRD